MRFNTIQIVVISASILLFVLLLSLGRTKPLHKKGDESSSSDTLPPLNDQAMLAGARSALDSSQLNLLLDLERQQAQAKNTEEEILILKLVSRTWNEFGNFSAGGFYAQKVAELKPSGEAWAIAGSTFGIAFNKEAKDPALKKYLGHKAVASFQKALELEPDSISHGINEAVMYVELSMIDSKVMPMTGAQKLLALDKKHPEDININLQLGRLSFTRSGDVLKAIPRFEKVLEIAAKKPDAESALILEAHFSLAECYKQQENKEKALFHYKKCIELTANNPTVQQELKATLEKFEKEGK
jgi:tetratricopeptide (TPR) repeat protein